MENAEELEDVYLGPSSGVSAATPDDFSISAQTLIDSGSLSKRFITSRNKSLEKMFVGKDKAHSKQLEFEEVTGYDYLDCMYPPHNLVYLAGLYDVSPAHRAAVDAKVDNTVGLGFDFVETAYAKILREKAQRSSVKSKLEGVENGLQDLKLDLKIWLLEINQEDSFQQILTKAMRDYETTGNGYIEIGRTASGAIGYIGHVPAIYIRVRKKRDGFVQQIGNRTVFFKNYGDRTTKNTITNDPEPNELIHLKNYSPSNNYYGVPEIYAAKNEVVGTELAARYNLEYFDNKAVPRYAIIYKSKTLSDTSKRRIVEFFETNLRGQHHRTILIPMPENAEIEFKEIEVKNQDSSFREYADGNNESVFMAHRTPMSKVGVFKQGMTQAASRDADKSFKESVCRPRQAMVESKLNPIVREQTMFFALKLNELTLTDEDTQSKIDEREVRMQIVVPDEVRMRKGMGRRPDGKGNEPWVANAQQAADQVALAGKTRQRDAERSANASDTQSDSRNPKGDGRKTS